MMMSKLGTTMATVIVSSTYTQRIEMMTTSPQTGAVIALGRARSKNFAYLTTMPARFKKD